VTPTTVQLWERIHATGLASPDECRNWAIEISKSSPESLQEPNRLAAELIRVGKITSFQANVLFGNLAIPLAIGSFRITESLEFSLGAHWLKAIDTRRITRPACWCYFLNPGSLLSTEIRNWPPSTRLAIKQVEVVHPSLDKWLVAGVEKSNFVGICEALEGKSLTELLDTRSLTWSESANMIEQIATGLQKMHDAGIVHGRIGVNAIWCVDDGEFVLRRDPVFPAVNPYLATGNSVFSEQPIGLFETAAPELTLPNASLSFQSDLYALGCVWYQSIARRSPYSVEQDASFQAWSRAHFSQRFRPLSQSDLPQPLQQCLAHLLAKNPTSRFQSASKLVQAIEFAVEASSEQLDTPEQSQQAAPKTATADLVASQPINSDSKPNKASPPPAKQVPSKPVQANVSTEPVKHAPKLASAPPAIAKSALAPATAQSQDVDKIDNGDDFVPAELSPVLIEQGKPIGDTTTPAATEKSPSKVQAVATQTKKLAKNNAKSKKKKSKKKQKPVWFLPAMIVGCCLIFGAIVAVLVQNGSSGTKVTPQTATVNHSNPSQPSSTSTQRSTSGNSETNSPRPPTDAVSEFFAVEPDDGQMLWAPPQAGSPYSLEMFPAGIEGMVFVSGNLWHRRGNAAGLSKWWLDMQPELSKLLSVIPLGADDRISSVAIALLPSKKQGVPQAVFRFSYSQPVSIDSITQRLTGFSMQLFDPKKDNRKGLWSNEASSNPVAALMDGMQTDSSAMIKRVVVGPQELIATLPDLNGAPAPVRRQLETLLKTTDSRSDLTLLFAPSFLFGDGRELLASSPKLQSTLRESIDETMQAVSFTTTIEPRWYMELRMLGSETRDAGKYSSALKSTLTEIPEGFEKGLTSGSVVHPYWRALGLRFPQMMRALNRYGRFGLEDGQVVTNAYLPTDAMNNIAIASWMALQNPVANTGSAVASPIKPATKPPKKSIDEILESKVTIGFEQESLEAALQLIAGEVTDSVLAGAAITMNINGTAFQKEGITRNQSIRSFKHEGDTLRNILMDLVRRANPVTTVQSPTEQNQKVVWLILDDPDKPGQKKIELTTRTWAVGNKATLPKEFVSE
jgi:serine/threonine protein kinase